MQGQERQGMPMAWSSSMTSGIQGNNNNKEVISPNPSMATTSPTSGAANTSKNGHIRTNSKDSIPLTNIQIGSAIPLIRSRTAPQGKLAQQQVRSPTRETSPQRERCYSGSEINSINIKDDAIHPHPSDANDWYHHQQKQQQLTASNLPPRQQYQEQLCVADPDSQEQALFEQRLCEDIYGVAVRKINQNGKSNLRYVKCLYVDTSDILHSSSDEPSSNNGLHNYSSSRSVSSRHSRGSRGALSRFLGVAGNQSGAVAAPFDHDAHRSLLYASSGANTHTHNGQKGKIRVLTWGKKKDVTVPLERFTAVRKGKVNDRSRRNTCDAARILSLVTADMHSEDDKHAVSLDIEAPTRLDRDKFAKAFSRFLNVPLLEEGERMLSHHHTSKTSTPKTPILHQQYNHYQQQQQQQQHQQQQTSSQLAGGTDGSRSIARSIKSDMTPQSWKGDPHNSIPDIALTATNSHTTNGNGGSVRSISNKRQQQQNAPLPVVTTRIAGAPPVNGMTSSKPPRNHSRRSTPPPIHPGTNITIIHNNHNNNYPKQQQQNIHHGGSSRTGSEAEDPPLASLPSSTRSRGGNINNDNLNNCNVKSNTISSDAKKGKMILEVPVTTKSKLFPKNNLNSQNHATSTPAMSATAAVVPTKSTSTHIPAIATTSGTNISNHFTDEGESSAHLQAEHEDNMDGSVVSSITGVGFDQDLVEELHLALERMRVELEESRAEASRAVKVAEQAIQSAENSNSKDWNNTVTHKAAEAAATAQKKSAEAMAKARIAEERLELERKTSALRKKEIEEAEQVAAHWQTRAAAAEVQRFAVAEALESERKKSQELLIRWEQLNPKNQELERAFQAFDSTGGTDNALSTDDVKSSNNMITSTTMELEMDRLRSNLARESARRRKLQDELQDLRGSIRVYCRLKPPFSEERNKPSILETVSNEILLLHLSRLQKHNKILKTNASQISFEFDGILSSDMTQQDVYAEFEAICTSVVEGFKICIMTYGQASTGKTHTMLGDVHYNTTDHVVSIENEGIHLQAMKQLFSIIEHRRDRFHDTVTINLIEVHDERLIDLLAGTEFGEEHGRVEGSRKNRRQQQDQIVEDKQQQQQLLGTNSISSSRPKLEIKTNRDGETVVRGVLSVKVCSFQDALRVWTESLSRRSRRLRDVDAADLRTYNLESHVVATLTVTSKNISTSATTTGRMQFVDFASSEAVTKRPSVAIGGGTPVSTSMRSLSSSSVPEHSLEDWKFTNKSLNTFREVILARNQYQRSVPYRNSTITHVLSDSLEADTKVVVIACVDSEEENATNTACTLQFAQEIRKVVVGKATRHTTIAATDNSSCKAQQQTSIK